MISNSQGSVSPWKSARFHFRSKARISLNAIESQEVPSTSDSGEQARGVLSPPNQLAKALQCDKSKERNGVTHHSSLSQKKSVFDAAADAVCSNY
jgi:hypothetical protein